MEILKPKIEAQGIVDVLGVGVAKTVFEALLAPYIGNGSVKSGAIKLVLGGVIHGKGGRIGNIISSGILVDASEDLVKSTIMPVIGGIVPGQNQQQQDVW